MRLSLLVLAVSLGASQALQGGDLSAVMNKFMFWPGDDACYDFGNSIQAAEDEVCGGCGADEICDAPASLATDDGPADQEASCKRVPSACRQYLGATNAPTQRPPPTRPGPSPTERTTRRTTTERTTTTTEAPAADLPPILSDECALKQGMPKVTEVVRKWRPYAPAESRTYTSSFRRYWAFRFGTGSRTECPSSRRTKSYAFFAYQPRTKSCGYVGRLALCPDDLENFKFLYRSSTVCNRKCKTAAPTRRPTGGSSRPTASCSLKSRECLRAYRSFNAPRFRNQVCGGQDSKWTYSRAKRGCTEEKYYGCNPFNRRVKEEVPQSVINRYRATNQFDSEAQCKAKCCR